MYDDLMLRFMQILMNILSTQGALEQGACLDALTSLMLDSSANQLVFCCLFFCSANYFRRLARLEKI